MGRCDEAAGHSYEALQHDRALLHSTWSGVLQLGDHGTGTPVEAAGSLSVSKTLVKEDSFAVS